RGLRETGPRVDMCRAARGLLERGIRTVRKGQCCSPTKWPSRRASITAGKRPKGLLPTFAARCALERPNRRRLLRVSLIVEQHAQQETVGEGEAAAERLLAGFGVQMRRASGNRWEGKCQTWCFPGASP